MRMNLPVTDREVSFGVDTTLVSRTDLKGIITYVNSEFVQISGYTEAELLGEPHNLVRHPDMPAAAFKDLWETIKAGHPWTGLVKNRTKAGDFYWVRALVTPLVENGQTIGYQSVRSKPHRHEIQEAERLFQAMNRGGISVAAWAKRLSRKISIKYRIAAMILVMLASQLYLSQQGREGVDQSIASLKTMYEDRVVAAMYIATVGNGVAENRALLNEAAAVTDAGEVSANLSEVKNRRAAAVETWKKYKDTYLTPEESRLVQQFDAAFLKLNGEVLDTAAELLSAGKREEFRRYDQATMLPLYTQIQSGGEALLNLQGSVAKQIYDESVARDGRFEMQTNVMIATTMAIAIGLGIWLYLVIVGPLRRAHGYFSQMSLGDLKVNIVVDRQDEIAPILEAAKVMQTKLLSDFNEINERAAAAERIKVALDGASTNLMIADNQRRIIYLNRSFVKAFTEIAGDIRERFPQFDVDKLIGQSIDQFHRNPPYQADVLNELQQKIETRTQIGSRSFRIVVSPVISKNGERLGSVAEWYDITAELAERLREQELLAANTRVKVALDNVSTPVMIADNENSIIYINRVLERQFRDVETELRKDIPNFDAGRLIGTKTDQFIKPPKGGAPAAAAPPRDDKVLDTINQTFRAKLKVAGRTFAMTVNPVLTETGERLGSVMEWVDRTAEIAGEKEVVRVVREAANGNLAERLPVQILPEGFLRDAGDGINKILEAVVEPINDIVRVLDALAKGDLTQRITTDYRGTFGKLKEDTNVSLDNLAESMTIIREATDAINTAAKEIAAGNSDLSHRTEEQAASLEETASSMEELSSTVRQNADNARQANQMAVAASDVAVKGGDVVQKVVGTMSGINDSSRKIVDIISVIDGIAFQTNILALNAAVEAARAGEQGRGFAVVAGEVRNLAQRSAAAAKEIKGLISDSVDKVEDGARLVSEAGRTMDEIVAAVKRVTDIMSEIAAASAEQSGGIEQVNQAITQMDEVTQQNAALVEQAAAASESLEDQASNLSVAVARFHLGGVAASRPATAAVRSTPMAAKASRSAPAKSNVPRSVPPALHSAAEDDWTEF